MTTPMRTGAGWIARGLALLGLQRPMKEARYPLDATGRPDLRRYTEPLDYYIAMHEAYLAALRGGRVDRAAGRRIHLLRTHAQWGLIAKGAPAAEHALALLQRREPEAREDGAAILAALGGSDDVVERLLAALAGETQQAARDSLVMALGRMNNRLAIPALAALIRDEQADADTRWMAVESLGLIVRKRFLRQPEPIQAARDWLDSHRG